jgi:DNA polymerase IV
VSAAEGWSSVSGHATKQSVNDAPAEPVPGPAPPLVRKIIHVDMDAFYASVEQRDDPSLRGRPVAVGGGSERGVVAAASYEARRFGVRSAMASVTARRRCPDLVFVKPRFDVYRAVSQQIRAIFADYTPLVEPLSLDEAYLDVTEDLKGVGVATRIAEEIRARIKAETGLTASAGVSYNKFLAKLASDENKPDGLCVITPGRGPAYVAGLPVARFHGVGPKTAERMARLGIRTGADLAAHSLPFLERNFGSSGAYYHDLARGICHRIVKPNRERKSVGAEDTFFTDLTDRTAMEIELQRISRTIWSRMEGRGIAGRTVVLKMKYRDFRIVTRSASRAAPVTGEAEFLEIGLGLLQRLVPVEKPVRLLGLTLSNLVEPTERQAEPAELALPL